MAEGTKQLWEGRTAEVGQTRPPEGLKWQLGLDNKSYPRKRSVRVCVCVREMVGSEREEGRREEQYKAEEREANYILSYPDEGLVSPVPWSEDRQRPVL